MPMLTRSQHRVQAAARVAAAREACQNGTNLHLRRSAAGKVAVGAKRKRARRASPPPAADAVAHANARLLADVPNAPPPLLPRRGARAGADLGFLHDDLNSPPPPPALTRAAPPVAVPAFGWQRNLGASQLDLERTSTSAVYNSTPSFSAEPTDPIMNRTSARPPASLAAATLARSALSSTNPHSRDPLVRFVVNGHKYRLRFDPTKSLTSVTKWAGSMFPPFDAVGIIDKMMNGAKWRPGHKYWGLTPQQIRASWDALGREACAAGTAIHDAIERFLNNAALPAQYTHRQLLDHHLAAPAAEQAAAVPPGLDAEWEFFLDFVRSTPDLVPYRTEWRIFQEDWGIAGSVDMVYLNPDGTLAIYDWKRCKPWEITNDWGETATHPVLQDVPDTKFWHYALQLNMYRAILQSKYDHRVTELKLVRLHPDNEGGTFELHNVPLMDRAMNQLTACLLATAK